MNITTTIPIEFWLWTGSAVWHFLTWVGPTAWLIQRLHNSSCNERAKIANGRAARRLHA